MTKDVFIIVGTYKGDGDDEYFTREHRTIASEETEQIKNMDFLILNRTTWEGVKVPGHSFWAYSPEELNERMTEFETRFPILATS